MNRSWFRRATAFGALKASQHRSTVYRFGDASRRAPDGFRSAVHVVVGFVATRDYVRWVSVTHVASPGIWRSPRSSQPYVRIASSVVARAVRFVATW